MSRQAQASLAFAVILAVLLAAGTAWGALLRPYTNLFTGSWAQVVAIGDVNSDGRNDVVVGTGLSTLDPTNDETLSVFLQTAAGTLAARVRLFTGVAATGLAIADVTGDGRNDVVVVGSTALVIFPQTSSGTLGTARRTSLPLPPDSVAVGDVTGDGRNDVVLCMVNPIDLSRPAFVRIYPQTASGTLGTAITFDVSPGLADQVAVGDINGDGLGDIVFNRGLLAANVGNMTLFLQVSSGGFTEGPLFISDFLTTNGVALGDVNSDGRRDLVFTMGGLQPNSFVGVVAQGTGGVLEPAALTVAPSQPIAVALGDVNRDGLTDVVTLHPQFGNVSVFPQFAGGALDVPEVDVIPPTASTLPQALAVGDISGDGFADVAVADTNLGLVLLLAQPGAPQVLSVSPAPAATGVPVTSVVQATFDQPMLASSITSSTFTLTGPGGAVPGTVSYSPLDRMATFTPTSPLAANSAYAARLAGGAGGVQSLAGVPLASDFTWAFSTAGGAGQVPTVQIVAPSSGTRVVTPVTVTATATDPDGSIISVTFLLDGTARLVDTAAPYSWVFDPAALGTSEGSHNITARALDDQGLTASASISVFVDRSTFDDVPPTSVYWGPVEAIVREGITSGCQLSPPRFCPSDPVTRRQMAVFLVRALGQAPFFPATPTFSDVRTTDPAFGYIERIVRLGITSGCALTPVRRYCPDAAITRAQMAVFLARALGLTPFPAPTPTFDDVPPTHPAYGYVEALVRADVVRGCSLVPLLYCPNAPVTRGQMAVFLVRAFDIPLPE